MSLGYIHKLRFLEKLMLILMANECALEDFKGNDVMWKLHVHEHICALRACPRPLKSDKYE